MKKLTRTLSYKRVHLCSSEGFQSNKHDYVRHCMFSLFREAVFIILFFAPTNFSLGFYITNIYWKCWNQSALLKDNSYYWEENIVHILESSHSWNTNFWSQDSDGLFTITLAFHWYVFWNIIIICNPECYVILFSWSHSLCHYSVPVWSHQHALVKSRDYMNWAIWFHKSWLYIKLTDSSNSHCGLKAIQNIINHSQFP